MHPRRVCSGQTALSYSCTCAGHQPACEGRRWADQPQQAVSAVSASTNPRCFLLVGQQRGDRLYLEPYQESIGYLGPLRFSIRCYELYVCRLLHIGRIRMDVDNSGYLGPRQNLQGIQR
jgi:hypothetical protein